MAEQTNPANNRCEKCGQALITASSHHLCNYPSNLHISLQEYVIYVLLNILFPYVYSVKLNIPAFFVVWF